MTLPRPPRPDGDRPAADDGPARPVTGDADVDRVLEQLDTRLEQGLEHELDPVDPVEAVDEAHRRLQARLTTPTTSAPPGQARPGPR